MTEEDEETPRVSGDTSQELVKPHHENPLPQRINGDSSSVNISTSYDSEK
jgi:hypothetical protein